MTTIRPFTALRPKSEFALEVASVPYDVVNREEAAALAQEKPYSFLRVVRSEIEFDSSESPYEDKIYLRAKENLNRLISDGILIKDSEPALYLYQIQMGSHIQTGIVGCSAVDDYDNGLIKIHEKTRPDKENDRTRHTVTLGAHCGPVFLAYRQTNEISSLVKAELDSRPLYDVAAEDGVQHRIWRIENTQPLVSALSSIPCTYVADGHHRAASASRCCAEMKEANPNHTGNEDYNFFLSVLFPHDELKILPYNRAITKSEHSPEEIIKLLSEVFQISKTDSPSPSKKGEICMYLAGTWHQLKVLTETSPSDSPVEALDVSYLQRKALAPLFGIEDPRTSSNVEFVGGIRGTAELERLVDNGRAVCAFSMYPVSIEELFSVADQGLLMAPKSTWFEPKLRSGLLIHQFNTISDR